MVISCNNSAMIRKILFTLIIIAASAPSQLISQCTADTTLKRPGYAPDSLPSAKVGVPYSKSISVLSVRDTTITIGPTKLNVKVDSIKATGVYGMPPGFSYNCQHPRCIFVWDEVRCVGIGGTATQSGIYPIIIPVVAFGKLGSTPITRPDTIRRFTVLVTGGSASLQDLQASALIVYPNPAAGKAIVVAPEVSTANRVSLYTTTGLKVLCEIKGEQGYFEVQTSTLASGTYIVAAGGRSTSLIVIAP
jgi:hypothetical protein